jgi:hypothetical protein
VNLGSPLTRNFKRQLEGSKQGASLFAGAMLGSGGSFLGTRKDMGRGAQGTGIILHGVPLGNLVGGIVYRALRRLWRRAPFSIGALLSIMGGPFTGNSERQLKGDSGNGASLSMGALIG